MLKIAVVQRFLPDQSRGGVGYFTHGLCNALQGRGHSVTVFSQDPAPRNAIYQVKRLRMTRPIFSYPSGPWTFPFQVAKQDFSAFDIIHAQGDEHLLPRTAAPIVRTMHGSALAEAIHNGWHARVVKRLLMHLYFYACELIADVRADAVIVVSRDTARHYPRTNGVIPNGIDVSLFSSAITKKNLRPTLLFVGDMYSRKRGHLLVQIFDSQVKPKVPAAELWLVCPEKVAGEGIRWFGAVQSEQLATLYAQAWVFCLPSSYEGFGRPYVEAMAAGTPVVATPNPGAREILDNGRFGLIVSEERLGETLWKLLTDHVLREQFGKLGIARARSYSWEKIAAQYEEVYEQVLRPHPSLSFREGVRVREKEAS